MSREITMSVMGLYTWDNTLFDLMEIPEGMNKDVLIDNLLYETAELEVLYPNPYVMKSLIGVWAQKQLDVWQRLYNTTQYDYNPIENYNRMETGTDSGTGTESTTGTDGRTKSIRDGGTEGVSTTSSLGHTGTDSVTGSDTRGHWKAGFDSAPSGTDDGLVKETRDQDDGTTTTTYNNTQAGTGSATTTFGKTQSVTESETHGRSTETSKEGQHTLHAHGNIGVMSTQSMIKEQREVEQFNMYDIIISEFREHFCILVY